MRRLRRRSYCCEDKPFSTWLNFYETSVGNKQKSFELPSASQEADSGTGSVVAASLGSASVGMPDNPVLPRLPSAPGIVLPLRGLLLMGKIPTLGLGLDWREAADLPKSRTVGWSWEWRDASDIRIFRCFFLGDAGVPYWVQVFKGFSYCWGNKYNIIADKNNYYLDGL